MKRLNGAQTQGAESPPIIEALHTNKREEQTTVEG